MKLYNIYESIILETEKALLTEDVTNHINDAIDGKYDVWFKYKDEKGGVTDRYVQIYQLGMSLGNNKIISAYQKGGKTAKTKVSSENHGWKLFRVDRIVDGSVKPVDFKFNKAVSDLPSWIKGAFNPETGRHKDDYNPTGNIKMTSITKKVDF